MKIDGIHIRNILGARRVDITTDTPITLIGGFNGAAKSSIQESVRMAFTGETLRVGLKKEYPTMVSEGAKSGTVFVKTDRGTAGFALPAGSQTFEGDLTLGLPEALPFVLNAQGFAQLRQDERRNFLFALTGCSVTEDRVRKLLKEAACDPDCIEATLPLLKSITGFAAAAKFAAERSTESRGAWRGVTGESYGSKKSEYWAAEKPAVDADALREAEEKRDDIEKRMRSAQQQLGALQQQASAYIKQKEALAAAKKLADDLPRAQNKLATDETNFDEIEARVVELRSKAGTAPRVGLLHEMASAVEYALDAIGDVSSPGLATVVTQLKGPYEAYVSQHGEPRTVGDPEARDRLADLLPGLETMRRAVENSRRDVTNAEAAKAKLFEQREPEVNESTLEVARNNIDALSVSYKAAEQRMMQLQTQANQAKEADERTAAAADHHRRVCAWSQIAEQLGPEGIPAQLLAQALRPFNNALRHSAIATDWRQVTINADMTITADGRAYNLHCESERWRIDAMIAEAISTISGVGILMLDRMDVLDSAGRAQLVIWLAKRAHEGKINTALLFATLKQPAAGLPKEVKSVWVENGHLEEEDIQGEQAAA